MEKISFLTDNSIYIIRYRKKMKKIENKTFGGERPLFAHHAKPTHRGNGIALSL